MSSKEPQSSRRGEGPLRPDLPFHSSEGLTPLRPEPPTAKSGLIPLGPSDGLRQLPPERVAPPAGDRQDDGVLAAARRRAAFLDWDELSGA